MAESEAEGKAFQIIEIIPAEAPRKDALGPPGAVSEQVAGTEPSGREERTEKMWVKFPAPPFTGFIITDDSTSKHLSELSVFSVAYLPCKIFFLGGGGIK